MFSTFDRLNKRTPRGGINREEYIEHLVEEFHTTTNIGQLHIFLKIFFID